MNKLMFLVLLCLLSACAIAKNLTLERSENLQKLDLVVDWFAGQNIEKCRNDIFMLILSLDKDDEVRITGVLRENYSKVIRSSFYLQDIQNAKPLECVILDSGIENHKKVDQEPLTKEFWRRWREPHCAEAVDQYIREKQKSITDIDKAYFGAFMIIEGGRNTVGVDILRSRHIPGYSCK